MYFMVVSSQEEMQKAFQLRTEVFVQEQHVPLDLEMDEFDRIATHLLLMEGQDVIGCGRIMMVGSVAWIGRVAVKKDFRKKGIGKALMKKLMEIAIQHGATTISLHAQIQVEGFYKQLGFISHGETFMDAGIEHIGMNYSVNDAIDHKEDFNETTTHWGDE